MQVCLYVDWLQVFVCCVHTCVCVECMYVCLFLQLEELQASKQAEYQLELQRLAKEMVGSVMP